MTRSSPTNSEQNRTRDLSRLEQTVRDLARDQRHLHEQIAALADQIDIASPAPASTASTPPSTADAAWRRAAEGDLKSQLRSLLRRTRALWRATDPAWVEPPVLAIDPNTQAQWPELAIVLPAASREEAAALPGFDGLKRQTWGGTEWLFWNRDAGRVRVETAGGKHLRTVAARSTEDLRQASQARYFLTFRAALASALPTFLELALLTLACEPLTFLEDAGLEDAGLEDAGLEDVTSLEDAPGAVGEALLMVERDLWTPQGLDEAAFRRLLPRHAKQGSAVGKVLPTSGTRAWQHRPTQQDPRPRRFARKPSWRQAGAYVIADPVKGKARHALRSPSQLSWPEVADDPTVLLLIDALAGGVERWIADQIRGEQETYAVAILKPTDALTTLRARQLAHLTPWIYPLADALPAELHADVLVALHRRFNVERILDLRSASAPKFPDLPTEHLTGSPTSNCKVEAQAPGSPPAEQRQALNLPTDRVLVSQVADLIPEQRPEDFVALAHQMRDDDRFFFVLAGRGPVAGMVEDLARFFGLRNFRLISTASSSEILRASDIVCSMAEEDPWPYALLEARALGRQVLGCADWLGDLPCGAKLDVGDLEGFAQALCAFGEGVE